MHIQFEWDGSKRRSKLDKHGADLAEVPGFDGAEASHARDDRADYGEVRMVSMVPRRGRLHPCCRTPRGEAVRLISARTAHGREARALARARGAPRADH